MKLKIKESQIRTIVNEEILKSSLNKAMTEQTWPSYSAYLLAEILKLEWQGTLTESNSGQAPSPEWIAETAGAFGLSDEEVQEATDIMNNDELDEGIGGFFKAIAKPYQNIWKTFTNITQSAANLTDPEAKKAAATVDKIDDQVPEPEELEAQVQQAASPEDIQALLKQLIALLSKADDAVDLDAIKPGMEDEADQSFDAVEKVAGQVVKDPSLAGVEGAEGAEGGGGEAFVYKGKGGKGLQSFLARGSNKAPKLKGKAMGAVLKHIEKQLKAQGVTVSESVMEEHYGQKILISDILAELNEKRSGKGGSKKKGRGSRGGRAKEMARRQAQSASAKAGMQQRAKGEDPDAGQISPVDADAALGREPAEEPPAGDPWGEVFSTQTDEFNPEAYAALKAAADGGDPNAQKDLVTVDASMKERGIGPDGQPAAGGAGAGGEEAPIEPVKPTVQNTAPEGSPTIKVFRGKGGEGLQSALAKNRDALGIDQQTVAVIIKSVEDWAQTNQIKVENVSADVFNTIISEISTKYRTRRLQESINKLKNV
jgi:hypothetical protein